MIEECTLYRAEGPAEHPQDAGEALRRARETADAFLWVALHEPTPEEFARATAGFGLHPLAVEDVLRAHQRPKLEVYADALFLVLKPVAYEEGEVSTGELMAFVGDSFAVTVEHGARARPGEHGAAARRLAAQPDLLRYGPTSVLYALCDSVVDRYLEVADLLQVDLEEVESAVFAPEERGRAGPGVAERVYAAKRQVLAFRRATLPLTAPAERLTGAAVPFADGGARPFFRDVHDHLIRVNEQVDGLDRLLSAVHAASLAQTSVRQNDEMRRISAWAAMVAIPTAVAGVYGMNFDVMPELHSAWGYPAVLVLMAGACFALFRLFRRRGWM